MEEKEKSCRIDEWAYYFLAALSSSPEERLVVLQKAFMLAVKKKDDETASRLMDFIRKGYSDMEIAVALQTDCDYRMAGFRADAKCCEYLKNIYRLLPDDGIVMPVLPKTKLEIIRLWMVRWRNYDYNPYIKDDKKAVDAFNFLISFYNHENKKQSILQLFREFTDHNFPPEIVEKWLKMPDVPEEIRKIFRIAWIRNGGQELFDRCMKNAEICKELSLDEAICSAEAKESLRHFCQRLPVFDKKIRPLLKEFTDAFGDRIKKIKLYHEYEVRFHGYVLEIEIKPEESSDSLGYFVEMINNFFVIKHNECRNKKYGECVRVSYFLYSVGRLAHSKEVFLSL